MATFVITTKGGKRYARLVQGRMYCSGIKRFIRSCIRYNGPLKDGTYTIHPGTVGFEKCDKAKV